MKYYQKIINDKSVVLPLNKIVVVKNGMRTINPTEEMVLADGWVEYNNTIEETPKATSTRIALVHARHKKRNDILDYDSSTEINEFFLGDDSLWIDKATRTGLKLRFESELAQSMANTVLW